LVLKASSAAGRLRNGFKIRISTRLKSGARRMEDSTPEACQFTANYHLAAATDGDYRNKLSWSSRTINNPHVLQDIKSCAWLGVPVSQVSRGNSLDSVSEASLAYTRPITSVITELRDSEICRIGVGVEPLILHAHGRV